MSEERLQEIKDSIEFQYTLAKAKGHENALLFTDEEQELVEEIERLHSIIEEAINYIDDNTYYKDHKGHINIDDLYIILQKGSDKE